MGKCNSDRKSFFSVLVIGLLILWCSTLPAATVTVNTGTVVNSGFLGVGGEYDPFNYMIEGTNHGYNDAYNEWEKLIVSRMSLKFARAWFQPDWFMDGWYIYDHNSPRMQAVYKYLDTTMAAGTHVEWNFGWHWSVDAASWGPMASIHSGAPRDLDGWAAAASECVNQLINVRGYTNIKYFTCYNEPDGGSFECDPGINEPSYYFDMMQRIHNRLVADGRRSLVQIWGPEETSGDSWLQLMVAWGGNNFWDVYTGHVYPWLQFSEPGAAVTWKLGFTQGKPVAITEYGQSPLAYRETNNYGKDVARGVINTANAGGKALAFWRLCDQYLVHPNENYDGVDDAYQGLHKWGFWNWLPANLNPRPAYYVLSLMTRYIDRYSDVLSSSSNDAEVSTGVFRNAAGDYTVVVVNDGSSAKSVTVNFGTTINKTFGRHLFTQSTTVTTDALLLARDSTFSTGSSFTDSNVPANSVAVYTSMAPELQVKVTPNLSDVGAGGTVQLSYQIIDGSGGVTWSVIGGSGNGSVNASGLYTAPYGLPMGSVVAVKAQSTADTSSYGLALMRITSGSGDTQAPTAPTFPQVTGTTSSSVSLSWTGSSDNVGVNGYKIFRNGVQVDTSATTSYTNSGLNPATSYTFNVSAYDATGNESAQSSPVVGTTAASGGSNLFLDDFSGTSIDSGIWNIYGSNNVSKSQLHLGASAGAWNTNCLYSKSTFSRSAGRAMAIINRNQVSHGPGPLHHLSTTIRPTNPDRTGYGWNNGQDTGIDPQYRNYASPVANNSQVQFAEAIDIVDTFQIAVMRPTGTFYLLAGGRVSSAPTAKLCMIGHSGSEASFYLGENNYSSQNYIDQARIDDLGGSWTSTYGIAQVYDSFDRANSTNLGSPSQGAIGSWSEVVGNWSISSNKLTVAAASALCLTETNQADGTWDGQITPTSGAGGGIVFRAIDASNYWYFGGDSSGLRLVKRVSGSNTTVWSTASFTLTAGNTYYLTVRTEGSKIYLFFNEGSATGSKTPITDSALSTATKSGFISLTASSCSFDNWAAFPLYIAMPSDIFKSIDKPVGTGSNIIYDSFTGSNGTALTSHAPESGSSWISQSGNWTIQNNSAATSTIAASASMNAFSSNIEVSSNILTPNTTPTWPNDWHTGLAIGTYSGGSLYDGVFCRFLWQDGNGEIEMWEIHNGNAYFSDELCDMNAVHIGGRLAPNTVYNMKLVMNGATAIVYFDNVPVVQLSLGYIHTGTQAAISISDGYGDVGSRWQDFAVRNSLRIPVTDTQAPTTPTSPQVTATTSSTVTLSWTASSDNLGVAGYKVYRNGTHVGGNGTTSYVDAGLNPSTTYSYKVSAYDAAGNESAQSTQVTGATQASGGGTNLLLNPGMENDTVDPIGYPDDWDAQASGSRDTAQKHGGVASLKVVAGDTYSYQSINLTPGTTYNLSVWAKTSGVSGGGVNLRYAQLTPDIQIWGTDWQTGTVDWTQLSASFTTPANHLSGRCDLQWSMSAGTAWLDDVFLGTGSGGDIQAPTTPANLQVTGTTTTTISLSWTGSSDNVGVAGYDVYEDGAYLESTTATTYTATGLSPGTSYSYRVLAYDAALNESALSSQVSGSTQTGGGGSNLLLNPGLETDTTPADNWPDNWQPRSSDGTKDTITRHSGSAALRVSPHGGQYSFQNLNLTPNTAYTFSGWVKTQSITGSGVALRYVQTTPVTQTWETGWTGATQDWTQVSISFTAPSNHVSGRTDMWWVFSAGSGWFDDLSLIGSGGGTWSNADVGSCSPAGSGSEVSGTFTVDGSGADIWGTADAFHYMYRSMTGDGTITARVATLENTNGWAKAGVMIRESLNADSANTLVALTPSNGVTFQHRTAAGNSSTYTNVGGISVPYWVRLVRSGSNFSAYYSSNGSSWTQLGSTTSITMASTVYVGLAVTSHSDGTLCTTTFDNVTAPGGSGDSQAPTVPSGLTVGTVTSSSVALSWTGSSDNVGVTGYKIFRNGANVGTSATASFTDTGLTSSTTYSYKVNAYDAVPNESAQSSQVTATTLSSNLLLNAGLETDTTPADSWPDNWQPRSQGSRVTDIKHSGAAALRVDPRSQGQYSYQNYALTPSASYTLSGWVKSSGISGSGVALRYAQTAPSSQTWATSWQSGTVDWTQQSVTFTAPSNHTAGRADMWWIFTAGSGWFDDLSLVRN